jgi:hypothetical protein
VRKAEGEGRNRRGAEAIGDVLAGFLAGSTVGRAFAREALEEAWRGAVGAEVAKDTRVRGYRDGVLTVEVSSSAQLQELSTFYRASILEAIKANGALGREVRELCFRMMG